MPPIKRKRRDVAPKEPPRRGDRNRQRPSTRAAKGAAARKRKRVKADASLKTARAKRAEARAAAAARLAEEQRLAAEAEAMARAAEEARERAEAEAAEARAAEEAERERERAEAEARLKAEEEAAEAERERKRAEAEARAAEEATKARREAEAERKRAEAEARREAERAVVAERLPELEEKVKAAALHLDGLSAQTAACPVEMRGELLAAARRFLRNFPAEMRQAVLCALSQRARSFVEQAVRAMAEPAPAPVVGSPLPGLVDLLAYIGAQLGDGKPVIVELPKDFEPVVLTEHPHLPGGGLPRALHDLVNGRMVFRQNAEIQARFTTPEVWWSPYVHTIVLYGKDWHPMALARLAHLVLQYALAYQMPCPKSIWMWVGLASFTLSKDELMRLFWVVEHVWGREVRILMLEMDVVLRTMTLSHSTDAGGMCIHPGSPPFRDFIAFTYENALRGEGIDKARVWWQQIGAMARFWNLMVTNFVYLPIGLAPKMMRIALALAGATADLDMSGVVPLVLHILVLPQLFRGPSSHFAELLKLFGNLLVADPPLARQLFRSGLPNGLERWSEESLCLVLPPAVVPFFRGDTLGCGLAVVFWLLLVAPVTIGTVRPGASNPVSQEYQLFVSRWFPAPDSVDLASPHDREGVIRFLDALTDRGFSDTSTPLVDFMRLYVAALSL